MLLALEQYEEFLFSELMSVVETREFSVLLLCFPEPDEKFLAFGLLPSKLPFIFFPSHYCSRGAVEAFGFLLAAAGGEVVLSQSTT